jgi:hypothetical protein
MTAYSAPHIVHAVTPASTSRASVALPIIGQRQPVTAPATSDDFHDLMNFHDLTTAMKGANE